MSPKFPMKTNVINLVGKSDSLFQDCRTFIIPNYQRNYSWQEDQTENFMESIKLALYGKQVFMGTVQFSMSQNDKQYIVIDGQQRMTTFIILFKILSILSGEDLLNKYNMKIDLNNFKKSENQLNDFLALSEFDVQKCKDAKNLYTQNAYTIYFKIKEYQKSNNINAREIANRIIKNVYFVELVIVKKDMPLSDVINIFNTINTSGMDLNTSDIFKLQYYDYLSKHKYLNNDNDLMKEINDLYDKVNSSHTNMNYLLDIFKHCIVAKLDMKFDKLSKSNGAFFEEIFSKDSDDLGDVLSLKEFQKLAKIYLELTEAMNKGSLTSYGNFAVELICKTRYSRYWTLPFVAAYFDTDTDSIKKYKNSANKAVIIAKYLIECSVTFDRVINPVQTYMCELLHKISLNKSVDEISNEINSVIQKDPYNKEKEPKLNRDKFISRLKEDLFYNYRRANLVCTLSALIDEINAKTSYESIFNLLFNNDSKHKHDIDHIYAKNLFFNLDNSKEIEKFNGIGNLILLESHLNRSLKDKHLSEKIQGYKNSKFKSVNLMAKTISKEITIENESEEAENIIKKRLDYEQIKLTGFLYENIPI